VTFQPKTKEDKIRAYAAMLSCPTASIGLRDRHELEMELGKNTIENIFPAEFDPENLPGVMHMGFHSLKSYGATPYFVQRPESLGNLMIDIPRFDEKVS